MELSLRLLDKRDDHDDLVLEFGGESWTGDSYYLGIAAEHDKIDTRADLRRLFEQWLNGLEQLSLYFATVYLPHDFSDEYTGWLECRWSEDGVVVARGWADVEAWAIEPLALGSPFERPSGFRVDGPTVHTDLAKIDGGRPELAGRSCLTTVGQ